MSKYKNMNTTREFTELLKGCKPIKDKNGNILVQSIMNMQLVCLTTDKEFSLDERFGNPMNALKASNSSYGNITFTNTTTKDVIIPTQIAVITNQRAQNHGMIKAGYVSAKQNKTYNDAGCVQGAQTGHFGNVSGDEFRMIPVTIREMLFDSVGKDGSYSRIYPAINKLGEQTKSNAGNYLNVYFGKYDKKLEEFIAHFEKPKNLIGVIVLIDGEIVAIDKFPSFTYADQIWNILIRDCYGALAIISELNGKKNNNLFTKQLSSLKDKNTSVLDKIEEALNVTKKTITKSVEEKIQNLLDLTLESTVEREYANLGDTKPKSFILKHEGYVGQVICESNFNHMVSLVKRESFNPEALRAISELKRKAKKQDKFAL